MGRETRRSEQSETNSKLGEHGRDCDGHLASENGKQKKRGWSDVFDNLTYSAGPGDNIYVFG